MRAFQDCRRALFREFGIGPGPAVHRALRTALDDAVSAHVLVEDGSTYSFRHPLYQHLARNSIPAPARRSMHARIAEAILAGSGPTAGYLMGEHIIKDERLYRQAIERNEVQVQPV